MTLFFKEMPCCAAGDLPQLEAGFFGLLQGLMSGALDSAAEGTVATARATAMQRFIHRNLGEPQLGVSSLLTAFGAARTTIFRDFEGFGGVRRYITDQRLKRAYADLACRGERRGSVRAVSEAWGFQSVSHFSRLFRHRFGVSPTDVVGADLARHTEMAPSTADSEYTLPDPQALSHICDRMVESWG